MVKKNKVAIIGTNGLPAKYGGFETLTNFLTVHLEDKFDFVVYCGKTAKEQQIKSHNGAELIYMPFKANGWQSIIYDIVSIIHAWFYADKLLVLGTSGALIFPLKIFIRKKIVTNIGGIEWARSKWSYPVRQYLHFSEWLCTKFSDVVITDNKHLQYLVRKYYGVVSELIEYGGNHTKKLGSGEEHRSKYEFLTREYALSVSRAQSDNNIHLLFKAFEDLPDKDLVVISNWNTSEYGQKLREEYLGRFSNIHVIDAIYDQMELDVIRSNASLYIHSHTFCGTAPSLVEAMCLNLPVICYRNETNPETTENKSYYFRDEAELKRLIEELDVSKLEKLGSDMYEIAERRYKWEIIARKYANCFQ